MGNNKSIKKITKWKKILIGIGIFAVVIIGLDFLRITYFPTEIEKFNRTVKEFEQGLIDAYKSDVYGGKTPEITYNLFIGALKNNDKNLGSNYLFLSDWDKKKLEFEEKKEQGELEEYIANLPAWEELDERERLGNDVKEYIHTKYFNASLEYFPDGRGDTIKTEIPAGNYADFTIIFRFNDLSGLWKISSGF